MSDSDIAIKVDGVNKAFKLPHEKQSSVKGMFVGLFQGKRTYTKQQVLKDISFEIKKGEFFGIVGRNGSGKSTLLKLLAGIYTPDKGNIQVNGSLTPFIELGVGFNPELTGRENVYLNGALLGFNRKQMDAMYHEIVEFAELEKFMDQKLKNYSSGMQVRLAFSIAIRAESDILVLDEVLAVGDADFQKKCLQYFTHLKNSQQTVVFVSHDLESVKEFCDRTVLLEKGRIKKIGKPSKIIPEYMSSIIDTKRSGEDLPFGISKAVDINNSVVRIRKVWLEDKNTKHIEVINENENHFYVKFTLYALKNTRNIVPGIIISNNTGEFIVASNSKWANLNLDLEIMKGQEYQITFKILNVFEQGHYKVSVNVVSQDFNSFYDWKNEAKSLYVNKEHITGAKVNPYYEVEIAQL